MTRTLISLTTFVFLTAGVAQATQADIAMLPPQRSVVITAADYTGTLDGRIVRMHADYSIRVLRDGWTEFPLQLTGVVITGVEFTGRSKQAVILPRDNGYALAFERAGEYQVRVTFTMPLHEDNAHSVVGLHIPQSTFSTMRLELPLKAVELREQDQLYITVEQHRGDRLTLVAALGSRRHVDMRWLTKPTRATAHVEPIVHGTTHTLLEFDADLVRWHSVVQYQIARGEINQFTLRLPKGVNLVNVRGPGIDDWNIQSTEGEERQLVVQLNRPLRDENYRLILEGEQRVETDVERYLTPVLALESVQRDHGIVAIASSGVSELAVHVEDTTAQRIDVRELDSALLRGTEHPVLFAFRYRQQPYQIALTMTRHEYLPVLTAVAETGELVSVLTDQGHLITRAAFLVKSNKRQFLGVRLPEGAELWSSVVGGRAVKPVASPGGGILISLQTEGSTDQGVPVELVYMEQQPDLGLFGHLRLESLTLDIPTTAANWALYMPTRVKPMRWGGNVERGASAFRFVDEPVLMASLPVGSFELSNSNRGLLGALGGSREPRSQVVAELKRKTAQIKEYSHHQRSFRDRAVGKSVSNMGGDSLYGEQEAMRYEEDAQTRPDALLAPQMSNENLGLFYMDGSSLAQDAGVLPLRVRLPRSGKAHLFHRLLTTQEPLVIEADYLNPQLPAAMWPAMLGLLGMGLVPVGGMIFVKRRR